MPPLPCFVRLKSYDELCYNMITPPRSPLMVVFFPCFLMLGHTGLFVADHEETVDLETLRNGLIEAMGNDFELVRDILTERPAARGGETYWLAHLKPKQTGHFALKYSFQYTHDLTHPREGENELFIRVRGNLSRRTNLSNLGLGSVCIGDTVIVPVRIDKVTGHQFSFKATPETETNVGEREPAPHDLSDDPTVGEVTNPLKNHLNYLGTRRSVSLHRSAGGETVTYSAVFEAKSPGRLNLGLSTNSSDVSSEDAKTSELLGSIPILIVNPGTPVTALVYHQNTINYSDNKRFSGHAGQNFATTLLILQPGDVFTIEYLSWVKGSRVRERSEPAKIPGKDEDPKLVIQSLPFSVDIDEGFNEWLIDHLPGED